jgi:tetratricopeptide (TPR) repeat protein
MGPSESARSLVGGRYQLLNQLGQGGMGTAYRALDRLSGRVVTLKSLNVADAVTVLERVSRSESRLALAQEFRVLASLRHPNIVSVLDYGFDEARRPFFCMELQEHAQTIVDAGRGAPLLVRADFLVQLLRALVYLHRQGIIHRDIKPENVVVVAGTQVKVLDFGLSVYRDLLGPEAAPLVGTLTYMAPELLRGKRPSEQSDLYAAGLVGYELFAGRYLLSGSEHAEIIRSGQGAARLLCSGGDDIEPRVRGVIARLLATEPHERYGDAGEVIDALSAALAQPFGTETVATRESFLQAAPFVGRENELRTLTALLKATAEGRGSTWLVGGESGVGKSRLLEEVRARALVSGFIVAGGQAVSEGGSPYHVWRDAVSGLILRVDINDQQAGVLKAIVPDIVRLLGRPVADAPAVDPAAARSRLILAVEELVRAQPAPVILLLEDLQWVGSESLAVLAALTRLAADSVLLIGSFRSDEAGDLPSRIEGANTLQLPRLDQQAIAQLARAMTGAAGVRPEVSAFLERETEGIPLFIVEAVRSLAESVGSLAEIGQQPLPEQLFAGGIRRVLQKRLDRVPRAGLAPLRTAAVVGREIDPALLRALHPELDLDRWLRTCAEAVVIEVHEHGGRFAHDKLREHVLGGLSEAERTSLHRQVAEAIEGVYPGDALRDTALAHHWRAAGDAAREVYYQERSASQALAGGAYAEAIARFQRVLELLEDGATSSPPPQARATPAWVRRANPLARVTSDHVRQRRAIVESSIAESYYRLGDLRGCERHAARALDLFGLSLPPGKLGWNLATLEEAVVRAAQRVAGARLGVETPPAVVAAIGHLHSLLTEVYFYSLQARPVMWSTLRHLNATESCGPSADLSRAYIHLAVVASVAPLRRLAARWSRHAVDIAERSDTAGAVAYALTRSVAVELAHCRWTDAHAHIARAEVIAGEIGDMRLCEEAWTEAGLLALYHGPLEPGLAPFQRAFELSRRSGSKQGACWSLLGQGDVLVRLGRAAEAVPLLEDALSRLDEQAMRTEAIWAYGGLALACLRLERHQRALESARRVLGHVASRAPVAYWTQQGTAAAAEVLLTLLEERCEPAGERRRLAAEAAAACTAVRRFARRFPLGRAHGALWSGLLAWQTGRPHRAMQHWRRAITIAQNHQQPFEETRAHLEIGRHLPAGRAERAAHLERARLLAHALGCAHELDRIRRVLGEPTARGGVQ